MGQKVNPIAVRLNLNRFSDSSWFSDYYYSTLLYQDLNFREYLSSIKQPNANKLGFRSAKCIIHHLPKRSFIHLFCLSDPRKKLPFGTRARTLDRVATHLRSKSLTAPLLFAPTGKEAAKRLSAFGQLASGSRRTGEASYNYNWCEARFGQLQVRLATGKEQQPEERSAALRARIRTSLRTIAGVALHFGTHQKWWRVSGASAVAPQVRQEPKGDFWCEATSILQKKRALVNLYRRLLSDDSLSQVYCSPSEQNLASETHKWARSSSLSGWFRKDRAKRYQFFAAHLSGRSLQSIMQSQTCFAAESANATSSKLLRTPSGTIGPLGNQPRSFFRPPDLIAGCQLPVASCQLPPKVRQLGAPSLASPLTRLLRRVSALCQASAEGHYLIRTIGRPNGRLAFSRSELRGGQWGGALAAWPSYPAELAKKLGAEPKAESASEVQPAKEVRSTERTMAHFKWWKHPFVRVGPKGTSSGPKDTSGWSRVGLLTDVLSRVPAEAAAPRLNFFLERSERGERHAVQRRGSSLTAHQCASPVARLSALPKFLTDLPLLGVGPIGAPRADRRSPKFLRTFRDRQLATGEGGDQGPQGSQVRQEFNLYAIHYYFMQKMGDSLGRLPLSFAAGGATKRASAPVLRTYAPPQPRGGAGDRGIPLNCASYAPQSCFAHPAVHRSGLRRTPSPTTGAPSAGSAPLSAARRLAFSPGALADRQPATEEGAQHINWRRTVRSRQSRNEKARRFQLEQVIPIMPGGSPVGAKKASSSRAELTLLQRRSVRIVRSTAPNGRKELTAPDQITRSLDFYLSNVHSVLSQKTKTSISLRPIKVHSVFQCASLVAQEVACKLEQKKSFRLICRLIFQQLTDCNYIKGIRINCSGRLNGAEIAKTECRKFGETSLHVFSDKIDYAHTKASTAYGILGVKVWISYI